MDASDAETAFYVSEADKATNPSLRDRLIEAGARALAVNDGFDAFDAWPETVRDEWREEASLVIDAVLDVLADRADEWALDAHEGYFDCDTKALIAVLRGDT